MGTALSRSTPAAALTDGFGRVARDLRLSVTDVCNLRCRYCLPDEQMAWLPREQRLDEQETVRLVRLLAGLGVRTVRVTGGEPLVRPRLAGLVARLAAIDGIEELSLTTNGVLLAKHVGALAAAGISRINVSLDSVDPQRFAELTRRDLLPRVLEGIAAAQATPGIRQVKLNAVALRGVVEHEALELVAFARAHDLQLRFIEVMPLDAGHRWRQQDVLTAEELRATIARRWPVEPLERAPSSTATVFRFADGGGEVGFIASVSEPFCGDCDRIRLTADGQLRTCLFAHGETDLRGPLRAGADDGELERIVREAVAGKQWGHEIHRPGFRPPARPMSAIGG
ncbi:GTP 3',8-cyclase MoaA [Patulibacter defluvii]|uniref:GTP 3',8-cyclase MoaA n=1 Tax=Patulibacter defluvii TaxID=3095358 RepID=UPI002A74739C|nr:GTP 3',8-cyclase MoaA [Patulibacter sp. DM4]